MTSKRLWIGTTSVLAAVVVSAAALLCVFTVGSFSVGVDREVIVPRGSPVLFSYEGKYAAGAAYIFIGDFTASGTYYYGYEYGAGGTRSLFLVPDAASAAILPHWKRWGPAKRIDLTNADDFARAALPQNIVEKIANRQLLSTHGHIVIVARNYEVTGECDQPVYLAKFQSVLRPKDMMAIKKNTVMNCG